ncbi:putative transposase [Orientia tsutsugamushi str. TA763]|nr:putative transposase [Orientia tsutsugamushi str. TA763]KJV72113.1 putative transposase [Orientia tsutsugamushi str. TA763]
MKVALECPYARIDGRAKKELMLAAKRVVNIMNVQIL